MTPAKILSALQTYLTPLVAEAGGELKVSETPGEIFHLLSQRPKHFELILSWNGSEAIPETKGQGHRGELNLFYRHAKGLSVKPAKDVHNSRTDGEPSLFERVDQANRWISEVDFLADDPEDENPYHHPQIDCTHGIQETAGSWFDENGQASRTYLTTFSILYLYAVNPESELPVIVQSNQPESE
jgi:hypothetical protein